MFKGARYAGTLGPDRNRLPIIHVKDTARAILSVFKAALEGKTDEGSEGLYFVSSDEPSMNMKTVTEKMGDIMYARGLFPEGGSKPLPKEVVDLLGSIGWSLLGGIFNDTANEIKRLGWEAIETKKISFLDSLVQEMEIFFAKDG
ncbi:hypothetical protein M422DRAFT_40454 [Sphaerobolus stellatus SS14]|nr:hypothetical protein M422DRAFT_40454 [Sphaerobolus stellatus SS14]